RRPHARVPEAADGIAVAAGGERTCRARYLWQFPQSRSRGARRTLSRRFVLSPERRLPQDSTPTAEAGRRSPSDELLSEPILRGIPAPHSIVERRHPEVVS